MSEKKYFKLEILTPEGVFYSDNVVHLKAPGRNGLFGVLLHHIPSYMLLTNGLVDVQAVGGNKQFSISGGIADISDHHVQIITESAKSIKKDK